MSDATGSQPPGGAPEPNDVQPLAMTRAQELSAINATQPVTPADRSISEASPDVPRAQRLQRIADVLRVGAAALALVAALGFALPALLDVGSGSATNEPAAATHSVLPSFVHHADSRPGSMTLLVMSEPGGAEVWVNGRSRGVTPAVLNVDCGPQQPGLDIAVKLRGYRTWQHHAACTASATERFDAALSAAPRR